MMNKKEKLLIYPYDIETVALVRHSNLLARHEISGLVSPTGWGITGRDAGCADGGEALGIVISSDFGAELKNCDTVFFGESYIKLDFESVTKPKLLESIESGKNIICALNLDSRIQKEISERCSNRGVYFKCLHDNETNVPQFPENEELYEINTPVVFISGIAERTQKFHIQLALREHILDMGYKISQIGSKSYCELLGFHSFPQFMYGSSLTESQKIILFNRYVKRIEIEEKPDVILIGIPGGIMPFNNQFTNSFGILAFEVSQAIVPDASVFSILYEDYKSENLEAMLPLVKYRLGFEIDCFNLSNSKFDWESSKQDNEMSYITVDSAFLYNTKKKFNAIPLPVYSIMDADDALKMTRAIIGKLEKYAEIQSV